MEPPQSIADSVNFRFPISNCQFVLASLGCPERQQIGNWQLEIDNALNHFPILHENNPVSEVVGQFVIVGHHQNCQRIFTDHLAQQTQ